MGKNNVIVGIAGGSGSGKSTYAKAIKSKANAQKPGSCIDISCDNYYKDRSKDIPLVTDRAQLDFDHLDSIDFELFAEHVTALKNGQSIEMPLYDFTTHARKKETQTIHSADIIILDGFLLLAAAQIKPLLNIALFIDASDDTRKKRRIDRDVIERGRTRPQAEAQYEKSVLPNHIKFVAPSAKAANYIIDNEAELGIDQEPFEISFCHYKINKKLQELRAKTLQIFKVNRPLTVFKPSTTSTPTPMPSPEKTSYLSKRPSPMPNE